MGKTLRSYITREISAAFLAGLAIFTFVLLIARILDLVDLVLARGVPGAQVLVLFSYIMPSFLELTIPMALLLGVVVAFGRLAGDGELLALRAAGLSLLQLMRPVISLALLVGLVALILAISARPWANRRIEDMIYKIAKTRATAALRPQVFNSDFGGMVIYVDSIDQQSGLLKGIVLSDERETYRRTTIFSSAGRLVTNENARSVYLQMLDGTSLSYHAGQESYDKTDFESFEVNLDLEQDVGTPTQAADRKPSAMRWPDLMESKRRRLASGDLAIEEKIEIQRKFVLSAASLLLAVIGVPLGIQRSRSVRARGMAVSIAVILIYYFMLSGALTLVRKQVVAPELGMWLPNLALGLVGVAMLVRAAKDRPLYPTLRRR